MKILLIGNYAADQQYSMQGFAGTLLSGLSERGLTVRLIVPPSRLGSLVVPHAGFRKWLGYADKYLLFPPALSRAARWADVVHVCDQGNAMYMGYLRRIPHLLTCHDVLAIRSAFGDLTEWSTGRSGRIYQKMILNGLKQTKNMVCVSEETRREAIRLTGLHPAQIHLLYNGLYKPAEPMLQADARALLSRLGISLGRFFLHVGGNQPYKNRLTVVKIFYALRRQIERLPFTLILAGKPISPDIRAYIADHALTSCVLEYNHLDDEALRALYSLSDGLIFPSLYEGFGLPIIEAQASGCPVFTSDRAPMTEIGGMASVYFDPTKPEDAAQTIATHLEDRDRMIKAGFQNVRRFSRDIMLDKYIKAYEQVASGTFCAPAAL